MIDLPINQIICGNCLEVMRQFPDDSVDLVVTSPPYWNLRQYFFDSAVIIRSNLTEKEKEFVISELIKYGVKPKYARKQ